MPVRAAPTWGPTLPLLVGHVWTRRTSKTWPAPIVGATTGRISNWDRPTTNLASKYGYMQIRCNGVDVTYLEPGDGGPLALTQLLEYGSADPFSDDFARIHFPSIYPWDGLPAFLFAGCDVDLIWKYHPSLALPDQVVFEGLMVSEERDSSDSAGTLTIQCLGALYEADLYVEAPDVLRRERDVGTVIRDLTNSPKRYTRFTPPPAVVMGAATDRTATFDSQLTGAIADLLAIANNQPTQTAQYWTVTKDVGRLMKIRRRTAETPVNWTVYAGAPGVKFQLSRDSLSAPTAIYGEGTAPDGCRWRNMKTPLFTGATAHADPRLTADEARVLPLAQKTQTGKYLYSADGTRTGDNSAFDPTVMVVEKFVQFGERVKLTDAVAAAGRDVSSWPADWIGSITLEDDPAEGHRRLIKAGDNIRLRNYDGAWDGIVFHISQVRIDHQTGTTTLTVDQKGRDAYHVDQLIGRLRDAADAAKRGLRFTRKSTATEDRIVPWDCEAGSGILNATSVAANTWKIVRIGAGEAGQIVRTEMTSAAGIQMAIAVFGYAVTAGILTGAGNPFTTTGYWDTFAGATDAQRPEIAWGGMQADGTIERAGHYPGKESTGSAATGRFVDDAEWKFISKGPGPWLWLAVYASAACTIKGGMTGNRIFKVGVD